MAESITTKSGHSLYPPCVSVCGRAVNAPTRRPQKGDTGLFANPGDHEALSMVAAGEEFATRGTPQSSIAGPSNDIHVGTSTAAKSTAAKPTCNATAEEWMELRQSLHKPPVAKLPSQDEGLGDLRRIGESRAPVKAQKPEQAKPSTKKKAAQKSQSKVQGCPGLDKLSQASTACNSDAAASKSSSTDLHSVQIPVPDSESPAKAHSSEQATPNTKKKTARKSSSKVQDPPVATLCQANPTSNSDAAASKGTSTDSHSAQIPVAKSESIAKVQPKPKAKKKAAPKSLSESAAGGAPAPRRKWVPVEKGATVKLELYHTPVEDVLEFDDFQGTLQLRESQKTNGLKKSKKSAGHKKEEVGIGNSSNGQSGMEDPKTFAVEALPKSLRTAKESEKLSSCGMEDPKNFAVEALPKSLRTAKESEKLSSCGMEDPKTFAVEALPKSLRTAKECEKLSSSGMEDPKTFAVEALPKSLRTAKESGKLKKSDKQKKEYVVKGTSAHGQSSVEDPKAVPSKALPKNLRSAKENGLLRSESLVIKSGELLQLTHVSFLSEADLSQIFDQVARHASFRWFAGRSILDFKVQGGRSIQLSPPYNVLDPLVKTMIALADRSMPNGEELAILQLIVNFFKDGGSEVKPHRHQCRQICVSLGATRPLVVEGASLEMGHGDALPLNREIHSVPASNRVSAPRVSVCLFYGSVDDYRDGAIRVNGTDDGKFGDSYWWTHPQDLRGGGKGKKGGKEGGTAKGLGKGGKKGALGKSR